MFGAKSLVKNGMKKNKNATTRAERAQAIDLQDPISFRRVQWAVEGITLCRPNYETIKRIMQGDKGVPAISYSAAHMYLVRAYLELSKELEKERKHLLSEAISRLKYIIKRAIETEQFEVALHAEDRLALLLDLPNRFAASKPNQQVQVGIMPLLSQPPPPALVWGTTDDENKKAKITDAETENR